MSYSLRQIALESKFCHDLHLDVFDQIIPASLISKVLTTCDAWEKRERDLNMVSYKGSRKGVYSYVASLPSALPSRKFRSPSSTEPNASLTPLNPLLALSVSQATRLFFRKEADLTEEELESLQLLRQSYPEAETAYQLVKRFLQMVRERTGQPLDSWLKDVQASHLEAFDTL